MRQPTLMNIFALLCAGMIGDLGAVQILQSSEGERLEHIPDVPLFVWLGEKGQQECFEIFLDGQLETTSCEEHTILSTASWRDIQTSWRDIQRCRRARSCPQDRTGSDKLASEGAPWRRAGRRGRLRVTWVLTGFRWPPPSV